MATGPSGSGAGAQAGGGAAGGGSSWRSWHHNDKDREDRRFIIKQIQDLFQKRKQASVTDEWKAKLPDFVRRLEEALYRTARSKEEYTNSGTLEARLQSVARRMVARPPTSAHGAAPVAGGHGGQHPGMHSGYGQHPGMHPGYGPAAGRPDGGRGGAPMGYGHMAPHGAGMVGMGVGAGGMMVGPGGQSVSAGAMRKGHNGAGGDGVKQEPGAIGGQVMSNGAPVVLRGSGFPTSGSGASAMMPAPGMAPGIAMNGMSPGQSGQSGAGASGSGAAPGASPRGGSGGGAAVAGSAGFSADGQRTLTQEEQRKLYILKQQRWLLFLRHASKCQAKEGECSAGQNCVIARKLWFHVLNCKEANCDYPRCVASRELLKHHQRCHSSQCPVCAPVRLHLQRSRQAQIARGAAQGGQVPPGAQRYPQGHGMPPGAHGMGGAGYAAPGYPHMGQQVPGGGQYPSAGRGQYPPGVHGMHGGQHPGMGQGDYQGVMRGHAAMTGTMPTPGQMMPTHGHPGAGMSGMMATPGQAMDQPPAKRAKTEGNAAGKKPTKAQLAKLQKNAGGARAAQQQVVEGTSMLEYWSADSIRKHLKSLRTSVKQEEKAKTAKGGKGAAEAVRAPQQVVVHGGAGEACKACNAQCRLTFDPPPVYCTHCQKRIARGQVYYHAPQLVEVQKHAFCSGCWQKIQGSVEIEGKKVPKNQLQKRKNAEDLEEPWVQCDTCNSWVHQVCSLFNKGRNEGGSGHFSCPECLLNGLQNGTRQPVKTRPQAMLEAKDLQNTQLAKFLEKGLDGYLKKERETRAKKLGKSLAECPTPTGITIRVVSATDKRTELMPNFRKAFPDMPATLPYRSKAVVLFQETEGVDLAIFCMYVQEYGADCPEPNKRRCYLGYLDSVKHFRPAGITAFGGDKNGKGDSLRTSVYQEVIVQYMQYLKQRGFTSMYIWVCPPFAGDDYIFYCHPSQQKTPKNDRLRAWYLAMLKHCKERKLIYKTSNILDLFFPGGKDHRVDPCKLSHLPYFDGDYLTGAVEEFITVIQQEEATAKSTKGGKKGTKGSSSRSKAKQKDETLDSKVMGRLSEQIKTMRDDFIMVHIRPICAYCRKYIMGGKYHKCETCKDFVLCPGCHKDDQGLDTQSRHPTGTMTVHKFKELKADPSPKGGATPDVDPVIECEIFETRQQFLSLCQGNHYQFDTLRRAKHSSMMVLYHLHNPAAPAFVCTCNVCGQEIQPGTGYRCYDCSDYDVCERCIRAPNFSHPHPLKRVGEPKDGAAAGGPLVAARSQRSEQLRRTMQLLVHSSMCNDPNCQSQNCKRVKMLFKHGLECKVKYQGGCNLCRRMWALLQIHAKSCRVENCPVPRCMDLRAHARRQQQHAEQRRRAAYQQMMLMNRKQVMNGGG